MRKPPFRHIFIQIYSEIYSEFNSLFGLAAIAWCKKTFRKYFDSEDNFTEFHKLTHRLLEAPTVEITRLLQDSIENWLREKGEIRAADWFSTGWGSMATIQTPLRVMLDLTNRLELSLTGNTQSVIQLEGLEATSAYL